MLAMLAVIAFSLVIASGALATEDDQITGRVTSAATKTPIEGVEVCAVRLWGERSCASTGANGQYTTPVPEPGEYKVDFKAPGKSGYVRLSYYSGVYSLSEADGVKVPEAGTASGINAELQEGGHVYGKVTDKVTHDPIEDLEVCVQATMPPGEEELVCAKTDSEGEYTISGLVPGEYFVRFNPGDLNYLPETSLHNNEIGVEVTAEHTVSADQELQEGGQISGTVTSAATKLPLEGAQVCATGFAPASETQCATTDAKGNYVITGLETRADYVFFSANRPYLGQYYDDTSLFSEAAVVSVVEGSTVSKVDASLQEGGTIAGQVTSASTGATMPGVEVCVENTSVVCTITEANGDYAITGLATGEDFVEFRPKVDPYEYVHQYYNGEEVYEQAGKVPVTAGATTSGINAALRARYGQMAGRVIEAASKSGMSGVRVCARSAGAEDERCAETKSDGEYDITGLVGGEYLVEFSAHAYLKPVYPTQFYNGKTSASEAEAVTVKTGITSTGIDAELKTQEAQQAGQIRGRVTDAATKAVIGSIEVCAYKAGGESLFGQCTTTNSSGEYAISALASGEYKVEFNGGESYIVQYYNGKFSLAEAKAVLVTVGGTTLGIDAAMSPTRSTPPSTLPANTKPPAVLGTPAVNETLLCASGLWTGNPTPVLTDRWLRDGVPILGAIGDSYKVQSADEGHSLACEVTARSSAGKRARLAPAWLSLQAWRPSRTQ